MTQQNNDWIANLWEVVKKRASLLDELVAVFPKLEKFRLPLMVIALVAAISVWQWDQISKIGPIAKTIDELKAKGLPKASLLSFSVAVAHIEADQNGDVESLLIESLKGTQGIELLRFDRKSDLLTADRPLEAEKKAQAQARSWLRSGGADLVIWGYLLPTKEKTVRIFITPRLTDQTFEAKMPADQSLDFPIKAGEALANAVQAQVLAYLAQFDPSRDVAKDLKISIDKLSDLVGHWPAEKEKAAMQVALGNAYRDLAVQSGDIYFLTLAVDQYRTALRQYSKKDDLIQRTQVRNFLGGALRAMGDEDIRYVHEAAQVYRDALQEISRKNTPTMWASVQSNLGIALHVIGSTEENEPLLSQAVEAHRSSLSEVSRDDDGLNWALMEVSLGNSLTDLAKLNGDLAKFDEAITAYDSALLEITKDRFPIYWAMIKCDEGAAQMYRATASKDELGLIAAGDTFSSALQVYSEEAIPLRFGIAKHNLGLVAYARFQLTRDIAQLNAAVKLLNIALQARTENRSRVGWAETQFMLGLMQADLAIHEFDEKTLDNAEVAFRSAASVFDRKLYPQRARLLEDRIERIPALRQLLRDARLCKQEDYRKSNGPACERFLKERMAK